MKAIKNFSILIVITVVGLCLLKKLTEYRVKAKFHQAFIQEIKKGIESNIQLKPEYDYNTLLTKTIIEVKSGKKMLFKDIDGNNKNIFINFWFKGCGGCEHEMPALNTFYEKYGSEIRFVILSNDKAEIVKKYIDKNKFTLPFYIFETRPSDVGIRIFPTNHLIINHRTKFVYSNVGYFDLPEFYDYINILLD